MACAIPTRTGHANYLARVSAAAGFAEELAEKVNG
jgi:hypothetical protein